MFPTGPSPPQSRNQRCALSGTGGHSWRRPCHPAGARCWPHCQPSGSGYPRKHHPCREESHELEVVPIPQGKPRMPRTPPKLSTHLWLPGPAAQDEHFPSPSAYCSAPIARLSSRWLFCIPPPFPCFFPFSSLFSLLHPLNDGDRLEKQVLRSASWAEDTECCLLAQGADPEFHMALCKAVQSQAKEEEPQSLTSLSGVQDTCEVAPCF